MGTIFTQDGQLISALESKVKHAQCFDVALLDDGSVVLASKDYRLYVYRYVQIPPFLSLFHDPHPHWAIINRCYISSSACGHPETNKKKKNTNNFNFVYIFFIFTAKKQTNNKKKLPPPRVEMMKI